MKGYRVIGMAVGVLLLAGCSVNQPATTEHVRLKQGQGLPQVGPQEFRLDHVSDDGKADFVSGDPYGPHHRNVGVGESFGLEIQTRGRSITVYNFTVEQTDPVKQEAAVLVRMSERPSDRSER